MLILNVYQKLVLALQFIGFFLPVTLLRKSNLTITAAYNIQVELVV